MSCRFTANIECLFRHKEFIKHHVEGYTDENVILIENGDTLEFDEYGARITSHEDFGKTFIDEDAFRRN